MMTTLSPSQTLASWPKCFLKMPSMATLLLVQGPGTGQQFPLEACPLTIGRQAGTAIRLESPAVSRQHARITCEQGQYFLEDLGSSNGTSLNGLTLQSKTELR